jgi:hypothetical protein
MKGVSKESAHGGVSLEILEETKKDLNGLLGPSSCEIEREDIFVV